MPFKIPTPLPQASSGEKRPADGVSSSQQMKKSKLPPLSELVSMEATPQRQNAKRFPTVAPLNIVIYKVRLIFFFPISVCLCYGVLVDCRL